LPGVFEQRKEVRALLGDTHEIAGRPGGELDGVHGVREVGDVARGRSRRRAEVQHLLVAREPEIQPLLVHRADLRSSGVPETPLATARLAVDGCAPRREPRFAVESPIGDTRRKGR
jgi:hypothetical protein